MAHSILLVASSLLGLAAAQGLGSSPEVHPKLSTWKCTKAGGCKEQMTAIVLDSMAHWIHQANDTTKGCGNWGSAADPIACPNEEACAKNCIMEGVSDYGNYGISTEGGDVLLKMFGPNGVASPRIYLLAEGEEKYEMLKLTGQEFSFDVDVSKLPCGMNGALYLSEMEEKGGESDLNRGGAAYGTGYCDAQCYTTPWVNGVGNIDGSGICCNELDIWEANSRSTHLAPHPCNVPGLYRANANESAKTGICDKDGCGMNPYRVGADDYYGPKSTPFKVDTSKPFTVITQFPEKDGVLQQIIRKYVQNGKVIENAAVNVTGPINDAYCEAHGAKDFMRLGAMKGMGESMARGMVLAMSIWWDEGGFMQWLDGEAQGAGPCNATEGDPKVVTTIEANPQVKFSQIKWGEIGSTVVTKKHNHPHIRL